MKFITSLIFVLLINSSIAFSQLTQNAENTSQILQQINILDTFPQSQFRNEQGVNYFVKKLKTEGKEQYLSNLYYLGQQLLNLGKTDSAIIINQVLLDSLETINYWNISKTREELELMALKNLALSYLRKGEQLNCLENHNAYSCIIPFAPEAIHKNKRGSEMAIEIYKKILSKHPNEYQSKWLLNIAYMTIGGYPSNVPKELLIDFKKYDSKIKFPFYPNVANRLGIDAYCYMGGANIEDFNNDGFLDVFVTSYKLNEHPKLFYNKGNGKFDDVSNKSGINTIYGGANSIHADFNNDGNIDIFIIRGGWMLTALPQVNTLLRNNGDGTFSDITIKSGLLSYGLCHTANWVDVNNDGLLDLFIGKERNIRQEKKKELEYPNSEIYINNGDETFTEYSEKCGLKINKWAKGSVWFDMDNDGWQDLFVSNMGSKNLLFKNNGCESGVGCVPTFTEIGEKAGINDPVLSFGAASFDFNNDGLDDLFVVGYANQNLELGSEYSGVVSAKNPPKLYLNNGDNTFADKSIEVGLNRSIYAMGLNFGDLDNDGWLDLYAGTGYAEFDGLIPNIMLKNENGIFFTDVTASGGFGSLQKGHGIAFGDIDNDNDQDIFMNIGGFVNDDKYYSSLYLNPGSKNNQISIELIGKGKGGCNKSAIGSKLKLTIETSDGTRNIFTTVGTGGSYGASSLRQEIGVSNAISVKKIEIKWSGSGITQTFENIETNKFYRINEGENFMETLDSEKLNFGTSPEQHKHHHH